MEQTIKCCTVQEAGMIEFEIPWPPTVNSYKKLGAVTRTKSGKLYQPRINSEATKRFYSEVWCSLRVMMKCQGLKPFGDARLRVELRLHAPSNRKIDLDNRAKVTLDALQRAGLYDDDSQIDYLLIVRGEIMPPIGKVTVIVSHNPVKAIAISE